MATLDELMEAFKLQHQQAEICNGDYLNGKSIEEALVVFEIAATQYGGTFTSEQREKAIAQITEKCAEWAEREGDVLLYYAMYPSVDVEYDKAGKLLVDIQRIWLSDILELADCEIIPISGEEDGALPKLRRISVAA